MSIDTGHTTPYRVTRVIIAKKIASDIVEYIAILVVMSNQRLHRLIGWVELQAMMGPA